MEFTLSELRSRIFKAFDEVIATGKSITVRRGNHRVRIVPEQKSGRLARLCSRPGLAVPPADLAEMSWSESWNHDLP